MRCPECGSEVEESARICAACGAPLASASDGAATARGSHSRLELVLLLLCEALIISMFVIGLVHTRLPMFAHTITLPQSVTRLTVFLVAIPLAAAIHLGRRRLTQEALLLCIGVLILGLGIECLLLFWPDWISHGAENMEHANPLVTILMAIISVVIVLTIVSAQAGRIPYIRRIAGLNAIDEAVGRATEMGRPILFSTGLYGIDIISLQALAVAAHVARSAVRYGTRMILPVCDQTMMPITEETIREVYTSEGRPEAYKPEDIRYLSDRQFAYAAGVTGILHREKVAATFLFGAFFAESLILAENGQAVGAIQVAGTPDILQTPFFVVTCDYTIIGDEFYAATAYISREPTQLGSLVGQDIGKALLLAVIIAGVVIAVFIDPNPEHWFAQHQILNPLASWLNGGS